MRRSAIVAASIAIVILAAGIFVKGTITQPAIGSWLAAGSMTAARSGAASALLPDGRILISGGDNGAGPVASAEVFDTTGSFVAAPPMGMARSAHSATVLIDGRVLVAGGSTGAAATNAAEIFDPIANAWTPVAGGMIEARSNHTASVLADGRVLFAGGDNAGAATASLEIFDPAANAFSSLGTMSSARTSFASAILSDGRVMLIGGSNGSAPVASTEIFDATNNSVAAGPALSAPRMGHSATTLLDGRVLVAGGTTVITNPDGSTTNTDLASAEIYDPATGNFAVSTSSLAAPRRDHAAFLLPNNNSVLIVGGTSSGSEVGTAGLFLPSTGTFAVTGSPSVARQHATGSALSQDGILFLAGGSNSTGSLSTAELYGFATVKTDKADYAPGSIVTITGSGWQPGETVTLTMVESPFYDSHGPFTTIADSTGRISNNQFSPDEHDISIRFYLTAMGSASGYQAQNTFTDSKANTVTVASPTSVTVSPGGTAVYGTVTTTFNGNSNGNCTITLGATGLPTGASPVFGNSPATSISNAPLTSSFSVTTTGSTTLGSKTFNVTATDGSGCQDTNSATSSNLTLVVQEPTTTTLASSVNPTVFGQSTTLTATVAQTAGSTVPNGGTVTIKDGATTLGTPTLVNGTATLSVSSLTVAGSPHSLTASYGGVANTFGASTSNTVTQTVDKATPTITFGPPPTPTYLGGNFSVSATTTNTDSATLTYSQVSGPCALVSGTTFSSSGAGICIVQASGAATTNFQAASNTQSVTIGKATPTLSVTNSPVTYNGSPQAAAVSASAPGVVSNVKYNGSATVPTNAGTYAITADFAPTDTTNYNSLSAASAGNFVINKGTATLSVTNSPVTYNGAPQAASVTGSVAGAVSNVKYNGSAAVPANANTYAITADFTPTDTTNYSSLSAASAGSFVINKATPTISVTNSPVTYNGLPQAATVTGSVAGTVSQVKYNGVATVPTNAATFAITANFTPTDTTNFNSLSAASAGNFVINKANPTLSVTNSPVTYNGSLQAATVSGSVPGTASNIKYGGSAAAPTNAGTYAITADFAPTDTTNYNSLTAASAGNFVINKATPTLSVTNSPLIYNGAPQAASVTVSVPGAVSNVKYNGSATVPINANTYAVTADFTPTDATNYSVLSGASAGNFLITQATPTVTVSGGPFTYDGNQHAATGAATGIGGASVSGTFTFTYTPPGNSAAPTNAGSYSVSASFTSTDPNYANGSGSGSLTINKATPIFSPALSPPASIPFGRATVSLPPVSVMVLAGGIRAASPDTVTITINGVSSGAIPFNGASGTFGPINFDTHAIAVGSYPITYVYSGGTNFNTITDSSTTLTVTKVTPTVTWPTPAAITFNTALSATQLNATFTAIVNGVSVPVAGTATYTPVAGTILNAGAGQTLSVNFVPTDTTDYNNASGSASLTVNKAATSAAVTSNNNPSFSGQSVTFTATVSNTSGTSAVPTGSVQFFDGASALGSPQPVSAGHATLTTSALTVAIHSITAVYTNSDGNFTGSTSAAFSQTVKSADTTTSISAPALTFGANGLVTVTVAAVDASAGTPTGNVTLSVDGGTAVSQALVNGSTTFTVSNPSAGDHPLVATYAAQNNFNASSATGNLHVNQAQATLSFDNLTFTYDGSPKPVSVTTTPASLTGVTILYGGSGTPPTNAGSTSVSATLSNPNYTAAPINGTEVIQQAQATLAFGTTTFTFDGSPKPVTVTTTPANLTGVSITYDGSPTAPTNAGGYALAASLANANYVATAIMGTQTIDPIQVTVNISDPMPTYDGQPHGATISIVPNVAATITYNGSPVQPTAAGTYAVVVMVTQANYSGGASGTLTIKKAPLTVTAADASRPYGQANPTFTGTLTGVVADDGITATYASAATDTTAAGVYGSADANAITPTLSDPNSKLPNYDVISTNGTLTITAVPLYVVANDKTRAFGAGNPAFDAQYFGLVNGDQPSSLTGTLACTSANASASAGTYAIHCGGLSSVDYAIYFVDGTLTVTDPLSTIAVTPNAPAVTYGGMQPFTAQGTFASTMARNLANAGGMSYQLHDLSVTRAGAAAAEAGGKLYAIGGMASGGAAPSNTVEVYEPMNDGAGWTAAANMGSSRTNARATSVAGRIYVFGGCSDAACTSVLGTAEVYNPSSNAWTVISSTGFTARSNAAAIPLNGKIYVVGGKDGSGTALSTVEIYDPRTDSWSTAAPLASTAGPASGGVINGTLYLVSVNGGNAVVQKSTGTTWTTINTPAQAMSDAAATVLNNVLYVVDGASVHAYDPANNMWTDKAALNTARLQPEPVTIGSLIYVAGNGASGQSASLEALAGDEASWSSSDTTTATIDQSGKASALKVGTATITATSLIVSSVSGNTLMTVGPVTVTPVVTVNDKKYDGLKGATIASETLTGVLSGDESGVSLTGGVATFDTKDVGTNKTVTVTGLTLSGSKAFDYVLSSTTATTTASIKAVYVQVTASSATVTYGDAVPTITASYSGFISGEDQTNADGFVVPTCVTNYTSTSNAGGSYYTRCSAAAATNYKFTYVDGSVTVNKATATINVVPYNVTYDGQPHTATGTATGVGGADLSASLNLTGTTHINAATYPTDTWTFTGGTNYNDASGTVKDYIKKANAVVVITPYNVTYDGHPHSAMVASITGVNGESGATVGTVDVSHTTHTDAGTYSSDYWAFTGTANYNNIASTTITDTINKATAVVVVTPYNVTYDGDPHTATATSITGVNGETGATVGTVDVSHTTHTTAGTYSSDYWTFTGTANYNNIGNTTITDIINKANATVVVAPYTVTYDGQAHSATVTSITGVNNESGATVGTVDVSHTAHAAAGTYGTDYWTFTGTTNYNDIGNTTITDTINKANAVVVVAPYTVTYDGQAHSAMVTSITGVNNESGATVGTVDVSHTAHTAAGTYSTDYWSFTGAANYNNIANTTIQDVINKATAVVVVTPYNVVYDGNPHTATVTSITGVNSETGATVGAVTLNTTHTDAAIYSNDSWSFAGTANYNDIASTTIQDVINKADATILVSGFSGQYDANAHGATGTAKGVKGEDLGALLNFGATFTDVPGGTAHWTFAGNNDYKAAAGDATITITQAPSFVAVTCPAGVTYNGMAQSPCSANVTGVNLSQVLALGYTSNVNVGTATASASYAGDTNHTGSSGMANFMISPAPTSTSVSSSLNPSNWGDVVTLMATVSNTNNQAPPTGNVSFYNAASGATCATLGTSTLLDTEPLTTVGISQQAATSTPNLPVGPGNTVGTDNILACFNNNMADPNFNPNFVPSNAAFTQTVNPAPIATLVPTNLSFGNQQGGTSSGAQPVTVCNGPSGVAGSTCFGAPVSTAALSIASIGFTNSNTSPVYFTQTYTCPISPSTLAVGSSCVINVKFAPPANASGLASALVTLTDNNRNAMGSLQSASLTGSGTSSISGVGSLSTYALFATASGCSSVNISGNGTVDSYNGLTNSGNVGTNGNATLSGNPVVNGAIYSPVAGSGGCSSKTMTGLSTSGKAQATGGLKALPRLVNFPLPPAPSSAPLTTMQNISGSCGTVSGCSSASGSKSVNLAPGGYGNLSATGGTTLHLSAGTYNFNSLTLSGNSILYVDSGPVVVNLAGASLSASGAALDLSGGSIVNPTAITSNLQFYYAGSKACKVSGGTGSYAMVYAPNAAINISGGAHFYGSIIGNTINSSGNTAVHYDAAETAINMGQTIWFSSSGLNVQGLPNTGSVKLYITNAMITFTANGNAYTLAVPNAVVTFSSSVSSANTTWDAANNRWSTLIPMSSVKGNAAIHSFFDGLAYQVPTNFPGGIQNVTWQAAYSTSTPGLNFNWQWGAAVYNQFPANTTGSAFPPATTGDYNSAHINASDNTDPAGTPESQKTNVAFGDMGAGYTGLYAGTTAVVPTIAPLSFSESSLDFGTVSQGGPAQLTTTLMNNDSVPYTISTILVTGTYASDFIETNNCPISPNTLGAGLSCTLTITLTPSAQSGAKETAKIVVNDNANNSPQTVFLKGIVQ